MAPAAAAGECQPRGEAALTFEDGYLTGSLDGAGQSDCYVLDEVAGARLQVGRLTESVSVAVEDATGEVLCSVWYSGLCELAGPAPYVLRVSHRDGAAGAYEVQAFRVSGDAPCPAGMVADFGDPGSALATGSLRENEAACWTHALSAGKHRVSFSESSAASWRLYSESADLVCRGFGSAGCEVPTAGTYHVVVEGSSRWAPADFEIALLGLRSTSGCRDNLSQTWTAPLRRLDPHHTVQVDCHPLEAVAGERVLVQTRVVGTRHRTAYAEVVDGRGDGVCATEEALGCVLGGEGPYRLLTSATRDGAYEVAVRSLEPEGGCPLISPRTFGTTPDDVHPGIGCRQFEVQAGATHVLQLHHRTSGSAIAFDPVAPSYGVYGPDMKRVCRYGEDGRCGLGQGRHLIVTESLDADFVTALHDLSSDAGCLPQAGGLTQRSGSLASGEFVCMVLDSAAGSNPAFAYQNGSSMWDQSVTVVDGAGQWLCDTHSGGSGSSRVFSCPLTGSAPFRAVVGGGDGSWYRFAYLDPSDTGGCASLQPAGYPGRPSAVEVEAGDFARCLLVPAEARDAGEVIVLEGSTASLPVELTGREADGSAVCTPWPVDPVSIFCGPRGSGSDLLLILTREVLDEPATFQVRRHGTSAGADGCTGAISSVLGGPATEGVLDGLADLECVRLEGSASDRFWLDLREKRGLVDLHVFDHTGEWVCTVQYRPCLLTGSPSYQAVAGVFKSAPDAPAAEPLDFAVDAWRLQSATGYVPECVRLDDYGKGFGPLQGTLSTGATGACVVVEAGYPDRYAVDLQSTEEAVAPPTLRMVREDHRDFASCEGGQPTVCGPLVDFRSGRSALMVLSLPEGADEVTYALSATCVGPVTCGHIFRVDGASPSTVATGGQTTLTVTGGKLYSSVTVQLVREGHQSVVGHPRPTYLATSSINVDFDLTGVAPGDWHLQVTHRDYGTETLADPITVEQRPVQLQAGPQVTGEPRVARLVTADSGTWTPAPDSYAYQWLLDGEPVEGATERTFALTAAHHGRGLSVAVTARRDGYVDGTATSAATTVLPGTPPQNRKSPRVKGKPVLGNTLKAVPGRWSPRPTSYSFQWYRDGGKVRGATGRTVKLSKRWKGTSVHVRVTAHRTGHLSLAEDSCRKVVRKRR